MESKRTIGSLLVEYGFIGQEELDRALERQREVGGRIGEILVEAGKITRQDIEWILSKQLDIPFIIPEEASLDMDLISRFPRELLLENRILPMHMTDEDIAIATDDPFNTDAFESIGSHAGGKNVVLSAGDGEQIEAILNRIYRLEAVPELVDLLRGLTERIRGTSFYRLDFLLDEHGIDIAVFGSGVLRDIHRSDAGHKAEDILKAFNVLGLQYLYEEFPSGGRQMLQVYPLEGGLQVPGYPLVLGEFGLGVPERTAFTDITAASMPGLFHSNAPVAGYEYLAFRANRTIFQRMIFTIDNVPPEYGRYHVRARIAKQCPSCRSEGCPECRDLGYVPEPLEGILTYEEIMQALNEGNHA